MKRFLSLFLSCIFVVGVCFSTPVIAYATEETNPEKVVAGNWEYTLTKNPDEETPGECVVTAYTGTGTSGSFTSSIAPEGKTYNVTGIEQGVFDNCNLRYLNVDMDSSEWEKFGITLNNVVMHYESKSCEMEGIEKVVTTSDAIIEKCNCGTEIGRATLIVNNFIIGEKNPIKVEKIGTLASKEMIFVSYYVNGSGDAVEDVPTTVGTHKASITYEGKTIEKDFKISPKELNVSLIPDKVTYDGSEKPFSVKFTSDSDDDIDLGEGSYTIKYKKSENSNEYIESPEVPDLKNAGTIYVEIALKTDDYTFADGNKSTVLSYTIDQQDISNKKIVLEGVGALVYNGTPQLPTAVNVDGLKEGTDYEVSYSAETVKSGIVTVTVTGKGNYTGTATATYEIAKADIRKDLFNVVNIAEADLTFDNDIKAVQVSSDIIGNDKFDVKYYFVDGEQETSTTEVKNVGDYRFEIVVEETTNYKSGILTDDSWKFTITPKRLTDVTINGLKENYVYTGEQIKPAFTVKDGDIELVKDHDYTVNYENNTEKSTENNPAIIKINLIGNYDGDEITKTFIIKEHSHNWNYTADGATIKAVCNGKGDCAVKNNTATIALKSPASLIYDETDKVVTVDGAIDGVTIPAVEYSGDRKNVTEAGFTATLTIGGVTATLKSEIVALDITDKDDLDIGAFEEMTYTGEAQTPVATVKIGNLEVTGSWSKVVNVSDKTTFTANGNFTGTIENVATGMKKADITYTAPTPKTDLVANGEAQALVTAGSTDFGELQYSLTNNGEDWSSDIPTGTQAKTYTVYYRVLGNDNVNNVDVASVTVTIKAHTHNWNYTADGATIKAVCNGKGDCAVKNNTATIALKSPASLIYDETDKVVTVDGAIDGVTIPAVEYSGDRKNVTEAGFTATLTIGGVTATLKSEIVALDITDKDDLDIGAFEEMTYTGEAQTPVATVKIGNLEVTGSWSKVVNVSDKTTFTANGNFTGTIENVATGMKKATVTIKEVEAVNREYDGTNVVKLSGGVIDGVKSSDIVTLDLINVTATVEDVKAGEYTVKFEGTPVLKGENIDNYELDVTLPETKVVILQCSEHKSFDDGVVTIEPTCKSKGIKSFTCGCGYIKNESVDIDPDAHKVNEWALGKEASCMNTGTETGKCEFCEKDVERETPKNPNNHNIKYRQEKAPTCVEEGVLVIYCANDCGYKEEQSIVVDETAHDMSGDWSLKTPATCSTDGVEVKVCQNEGCTHEETRPVKADGESHSMGEWIVDTVATCMAEGQKVRACTIKGCTHKETEVIPVDKTAHDMSGEWKTTIAATCVDEGEEELKCKNEGCNHIETRVIEPDGKTHKLSGWRISVAVKCTVAGEIENVCTNKGCTYRQIMPIEPDGKSHDPAEEFTVIPATCVKTGEKFKICENPDCTVRFEEEILEIDKDAHTKTELVKESAPTCLEIGYSGDTVCVDCEKILEPGMEIPATGHKSSDWIVDKKATFKATGERHKECTTCKEVLKKEKIAKLTLDTPKVKIENAYNGIKVTWSQDEDAAKYIIYSSEYNTKTKKWSSWKNRGTVKATVKSWVDTKVKNNVTYRYTVKAVNGEYKSSNKATSGLKFITAPTAKVSVTATGVLVKWNKISIADNYIVYRSESKNGKWQDWKKLGTTKPAKNSWTDTKAKSGVTYRYTVIVLDGKTKSGPRASASIIFLEQPTLKISNGASGVTGKWEPISGAKGYTVLRSEYNAKTKKWSKWLDLGTAKSTAKSFTDKTVKSGVTYRYALRAVNGKFKSTYQASNTLIYLARPTLKIANTSSGIKGTWNKISGATGYTIYRSELKNGKWTEWLNLGTAKSTAKSFTDKTVKSGTTYKYKLRAINGKYKSSDFATGANVFLSTPTVKIANASTGVKVSWGKITGAESYKIYRRQLEDGKWTAWKALGTTTKNSYVDKTANNNVNYRYTVKAINGKCYSEVKTSSTLLYLAAPTVVVENVESGINVSWNKISGAKTYAIYRANLEKDGDWSDWGIVATVKNNKLSVTDKTVKNGETYRYIVRAVSDKVKSSYVASSAIVAGENFQEETTQPTESTT